MVLHFASINKWMMRDIRNRISVCARLKLVVYKRLSVEKSIHWDINQTFTPKFDLCLSLVHLYALGWVYSTESRRLTCILTPFSIYSFQRTKILFIGRWSKICNSDSTGASSLSVTLWVPSSTKSVKLSYVLDTVFDLAIERTIHCTQQRSNWIVNGGFNLNAEILLEI